MGNVQNCGSYINISSCINMRFCWVCICAAYPVIFWSLNVLQSLACASEFCILIPWVLNVECYCLGLKGLCFQNKLCSPVLDVRGGFVKMFRGLLHWCLVKSRERTCPDCMMMFVRARPAFKWNKTANYNELVGSNTKACLPFCLGNRSVL
jgi:hypothetical protein